MTNWDGGVPLGSRPRYLAEGRKSKQYLRRSGVSGSDLVRGCSSVGRALQSHCRGQGFDSPQLHRSGTMLAWGNCCPPPFGRTESSNDGVRGKPRRDVADLKRRESFAAFLLFRKAAFAASGLVGNPAFQAGLHFRARPR